ncbi:MAG: DUF805 domain-containing protein [Alphaproteobacteria bacterium]
MDFGKLFFSAYGRIGRQEFWVGWAILLMVGIFTCFIPFVNFIAWCGLLYCGICIRTKRLHDMGRSGWLQVIPVVAKLVFGVIVFYLIIFGAIAGYAWGHAALPGIAIGVATLIFSALAAWLIQVGFLLWIGIAERDPYDNIYGPGPTDEDYRMGAPA